MSSKPQRAPNALPPGPVPGCSPCPERAVAGLPSPRWLSLTLRGTSLIPVTYDGSRLRVDSGLDPAWRHTSRGSSCRGRAG